MCTSQGVITCKAAVCWGLGMTVKLEEIQVDPPKSGEVRVKTLCASICHTDVLGIQGSPYVNGFPLVPGHEGIGRGYGDSNIYRRVWTLPELCLRKDQPLPDIHFQSYCRGKKLQHTWTCATWLEYTVVNANYLLKVDPGINLAHASFISCGFSTGYGAAGRKPKLKVDQVLLFSVLVIGVWGYKRSENAGGY
ncbi:hypothetical protein Ahy_B03g061799 isoform C [Arachis hypogaea]|uniref:Alcohol dehydrogenase-like N-terminal domain-containing protein n=1 Tax=Arachis hypogaea TaxID=3818 RepID=A0A444ZS06_ARAHY|nr:hypothetical protein Ahy_B03g061799 isoform C [Arachis hypogaea]